jgi:hypothetical protein
MPDRWRATLQIVTLHPLSSMRKSLATFAVLACALTACATESTSSLPAGAASYLAAVPASTGTTPVGSLLVSTTENGVTTDRVAAGAEIRLVLAPDSSTSGHLFVPAASVGGGATADFDADLAGTWSKTDNIVTLHHAADTFLRDMPLIENGNQLVGDRSFGNVRVRLTLVRQ